MASGSEVLRVEEVGFEIEGIAQAVRRIDAHHQRAVAEFGELDAGGGGQTGLADAAFSAEEQNAHNSIIAPR